LSHQIQHISIDISVLSTPLPYFEHFLSPKVSIYLRVYVCFEATYIGCDWTLKMVTEPIITETWQIYTSTSSNYML